ncbi:MULTISPECIES: hypothetical protein [Thermomonospora]|uniref:Uncharacterized protein n=1 Tax=Thermomonospora curvata (strain ATCC 19995 / DSM 43183 / JCM 3096 / KCTC 9072 / NBRC 15933 / NCIMB 10081 / Henssen B9) TaxID=471852 RepID=D1AAL6_THECD|nr:MULTISPECIES: hypothetical protein [Thermomonospora]ACY97026.1 hypothetical protein Tcur_1447 [Thermomonospora curvata DSM 43183]PKK14910.1 MAG: hypothetical protein BUE48_007045 [Thermomonospora sp. CIF 1]
MTAPHDPVPERRTDQAAERAVFVRYLQAVINVYGPWLDSDVITGRELRIARDRVAKARDLLARFTGPGAVPNHGRDRR